MKNIDYTIVIPAFNESESISKLLERIKNVFQGDFLKESSYELLVINDGSSDETLSAVRNWIKINNVQSSIINFRKNRGKSYALAAGFDEACGDIVITIDADLQDDPNEIINLIQKINEDFDLVSGWKKFRNDPYSKKIPSLIFNKVTSLISGVKLNDFNCGLKAYKKEVIKDVNLYGELHRYIPVLAFWRGYKITEIPVKHHRRKYGKSKYGLERYLRGFLDLITITFLNRYLKRPLHLFGGIGLLLIIIGSIIEIYLSALWFIGIGIGSRPLFFLGILLIIAGLQCFFFGLLGDMIVSSNPSQLKYSKEKYEYKSKK